MHLFWCWCIMLETSGIFKWNYTFFHDFLSENVCCAIKFDGRAFCRNCFHNIQINEIVKIFKVIKLQKEIVSKSFNQQTIFWTFLKIISSRFRTSKFQTKKLSDPANPYLILVPLSKKHEDNFCWNCLPGKKCLSSSNKVRKAQNEHINIVCQNLISL